MHILKKIFISNQKKKMTQTKKYAIRCSSEEEARELMKIYQDKWWKNVVWTEPSHTYPVPWSISRNSYDFRNCFWIATSSRYEKYWYTIISYKEAVEMWLLGEHYQNTINTVLTDNETPNQKELDDRDNDLADIFNTSPATENKWDLYMRIIEYLVKKWFLQDKYGKVLSSKVFGKSENVVEEIMEDMLKRAKEIDNEWLCLWLFTIQEILTKHLSSK